MVFSIEFRNVVEKWIYFVKYSYFLREVIEVISIMRILYLKIANAHFRMHL